MISVRGLTKQYGEVVAVDDLSFDIAPGKVTGFLGPNGAGKSTTMRLVLGLDRPTSGSVLVAGQRYAAMDEPLKHVGALLDAGALHPGRTGRNHLKVAARTHGIPLSRVDEVLDEVGLTSAARRRVRGYSLGMRQRLGIAAALLGDPGVLLFDEPVNGLDLEGVRWIRDLLRRLASEGRTVLVSSHLMSEMQLVADHLLVIGRGRLLADASLDTILRGLGAEQVRVRVARPDAFVEELRRHDLVVSQDDDGLVVSGGSARDVGALAHRSGFEIHHLAEVEQSLEHAYLRLTDGDVEYAARQPAPEGAPA